jgi:hypothetical protein
MTPQLILEPPPGFAGLTLGESKEDNARTLHELAGRIAVQAGVDTGTMAGYLTVLATVMAVNKVQLYGRFTVSTVDSGQVASLALCMLPLASPSDNPAIRHRPAAAAELLKQHRKRVPHAEAHVVELPIGPAMIAATAGEHRLPSGRVVPEFKAEFQIPAPDGVQLIVLAVTTESETAWPSVAAAAKRVAESLRFTLPEE